MTAEGSEIPKSPSTPISVPPSGLRREASTDPGVIGGVQPMGVERGLGTAPGLTASVRPMTIDKVQGPRIEGITRVQHLIVGRGLNMAPNPDFSVESVVMGAAVAGRQPSRSAMPVFVENSQSAHESAPETDFRVRRTWTTGAEFELARAKGLVGIRWVGRLFDDSPYGEACRRLVGALATTGLHVSSRAITSGETAARPLDADAASTLNRGIRCAINVVHSIPRHFRAHKDPVLHNIGFFACEADTLPAGWAGHCNSMDEIFVPCQRDKDACVRAGVRKPVHVVGDCGPSCPQMGKRGPTRHLDGGTAPRAIREALLRALSALAHGGA